MANWKHKSFQFWEVFSSNMLELVGFSEVLHFIFALALWWVLKHVRLIRRVHLSCSSLIGPIQAHSASTMLVTPVQIISIQIKKYFCLEVNTP